MESCKLLPLHEESVFGMATARPPDENIAWKVWVGSIVGVVLSTVAVIARIVARRLSAAEFWWDDFFIVFALVSRSSTDV